MSIFSKRPPGYKAGVILLFLATVTFFVGFVSPFWISVEDKFTNNLLLVDKFTNNLLVVDKFTNNLTQQGLWMRCRTVEEEFSCTLNHVEPPWYAAWQALESVCLAALLAAGYFCFHVNYCSVNYSRFLEVVAGVGGVMGFSGTMLFLGMTIEKNPRLYLWGFYLATVGSGLAVIAAAVIAGNNKPNLQHFISVATPTTQESSFTSNGLHNQAYASENPNTRYNQRAGNDVNPSSLQHPRDMSAVYSAYSQERLAPMDDVHTGYNRTGYGQSGYSSQSGNRSQAGFGQSEYGLSRYSR